MHSMTMRRVDRVVRTVANKDVVVTLVGESGSGKEVLARRIHELSHRRSGPFVPINCAAIPETLLESELFGHERGAFTGASDRATGKIEAASGGTLFLDEIGEMPFSAQAKVLRFLENRRFMRVGGTAKIVADVRLITATLRSLDEEVRLGRFRADLYYRIQGITVHVPPLRERQVDLVPLVRQFVAEISAKHGTKPPRLTRQTLVALRSYSWPGNVRELRNVIELLCLLREGKSVRPNDLPDEIVRACATPQRDAASNNGSNAGSVEIPIGEPLERSIERILRATLDVEGGNRSRAARRLAISLRTMQRHANRLGLRSSA